MNSTINAAATKQGLIGSVDNSINLLFGNVAFDDCNSVQHHSIPFNQGVISMALITL